MSQDSESSSQGNQQRPRRRRQSSSRIFSGDFEVEERYRNITGTTRRTRAMNQERSQERNESDRMVDEEQGAGEETENVQENFERVMERDYGRQSLVCELLHTKKARTLSDSVRRLIQHERRKMESDYPRHTVIVPKEVKLNEIVRIDAVPRDERPNPNVNETFFSRNTYGQTVTRILNLKKKTTSDVIFDCKNASYSEVGPPVTKKLYSTWEQRGSLNRNVFQDEAFLEDYEHRPMYTLFSLFFGSPTDVENRGVEDEDEGDEGDEADEIEQPEPQHSNRRDRFRGGGSWRTPDEDYEEEDEEDEGEIEEPEPQHSNRRDGFRGGRRYLPDEDDEEEEDEEEEIEEPQHSNRRGGLRGGSRGLPDEEEEEEEEQLCPGNEFLLHLYEETNLFALFRKTFKDDIDKIRQYYVHKRVKRRMDEVKKRNQKLSENYGAAAESDSDDDDDDDEEEEDSDESDLEREMEEDDNLDVDPFDGPVCEEERQEEEEDDERLMDDEDSNPNLLPDHLFEEYKELKNRRKFKVWKQQWKLDNPTLRVPETYSMEDIQTYIIVVLLMGLEMGDSNTTRIWGTSSPKMLIHALMSRDKFERMTACVHYDYVTFRDWFNRSMKMFYTPGLYLTVDESMVGYRGVFGGAVKIPGKPKSKGIKVLCLNDSQGFCQKLVVYFGKKQRFSNKRDFEHTSRGVPERLIHDEDGNKESFFSPNSIMFLDRWFGCYEVLKDLHDDRLAGVMTLRTNRAAGRTVLDALHEITKAEENKGMHESVVLVENQDLMFTAYNDSSTVLLMSYRVADRVVPVKGKHGIVRKKPLCVALYNKGMLGVDRMDRMIYQYQNNRRFRRYTTKLLFYFLPLMMHNLYVIHKCLDGPGAKKTLFEFLYTLGKEYVGLRYEQSALSQTCIANHTHLPVLFNKEGGKCSYCDTYRRKGTPMTTCSFYHCRNTLRIRFCARKRCHYLFHKEGCHLLD